MQYSLFGAAVAPPSRADLDGLVLAGAQWVRNAAGAARLSVLVAGTWRARALQDELGARSLPADVVESHLDARDLPGGGGALRTVRTAFTPDLGAAAVRWVRGARSVVPDDLTLSAGGLRLWSIATGRHDEGGFLLATPDADSPLHRAAGARLAALGVAAVSVGVRGGPGWRVTGAKRLRRLAELVGEAPDTAGADWPSSR